MMHLLGRLLAVGPPSTEVVRSFDLGRLSFAAANRLNGKPVRVSFVVTSAPDALAREPSVDAAGDRKAARSVRFSPGIPFGNVKMGQRLTVEGVMRVRLIIYSGGPADVMVRQIEVRDARLVSP